MIFCWLFVVSGNEPQHVLEGRAVVRGALGGVVGERLRRAVDAEQRRYAEVVGLLRAVADAADDGDQRDALGLGAPGDAGDDLAVDALAVDAPLAGDDQLRAVELRVEVHHVQHRLDARAHLRVLERRAARAHTARRARAGDVGDALAEVALDDRREVGEVRVQTLHHGGVRALLRAEDPRRAALAAQRVVHVGHQRQLHAGEQLVRRSVVDARELVQRVADGDELLAVRVEELCAQRRRAAAAAVVGAASAEAEQNLRAAVFNGVADQRADAEGGGRGGVLALADHRQARRARHFDDGALALARVDRLHRLAVGPADDHRYRRRADRLDEAAHRALAAVGDGDADDLAAWENLRHTLAGDGADLLTGQRALEGIRDDDDLFHLTC